MLIERKLMKKFLHSLFYLFFPLIIGGIVALLIRNNIDYNILNKPIFAPPKIIFPIAWTIIYLLLGISYYLYKKNYKENSFTDKLYYFALLVNVLWSIIFFLWKLRFLAILWIILLDILVITLLIIFFKKKPISAYLNIPYLIWILFATYLTIGIYFLN